MKAGYWVIIIVILVGFGVFWFTIHPSSLVSPPGTAAFKCSDGRVVFRYDDPDNAFPEFTRNYDASYKVTSGVLGKLVNDTDDAAVALGVNNVAQALIDTLDQQNIFYQTTLKAYFIESNNDPCDQQLRDKYLAFIDKMATDMVTMRSFVSQITTTVSNTQNTADTAKKLLAVIDTSKANVDTTTKNLSQVPDNKLVVLKNYSQVNSAITTLARKYKINAKAMQMKNVQHP